jgi:hypothetical protein
MKHYKLRCTVSNDEYTTSNVFVEIYCKGNNYLHALQDARTSLERDYPMLSIDTFDNINISLQWEDEK